MISSMMRVAGAGEGSPVRSVPRTHLYVPADQPRFIRRSASIPADALIFDLEDGVAPQRKDHARAAALEALSERPADDREYWVRINTGERGRDDARAVVTAGHADGIWLPKAEPDDTRALAGLLDDLDAATESDATGGSHAAAESDTAGGSPATAGQGGRRTPTPLGLLIESAAAALRLTCPHGDAAWPRRVLRLQLGEMDLRADLRMPPEGPESDVDWIRGVTVAYSAATGLQPPVGPVFADVSDSDGFRASCSRLRRLGFHGRACIHPRQVEIANEVFGVSDEELAAARSLLDRFDDAMARGHGAFRDVTGAMVDAASVRTAQRLTGRDAPAASAGRAGTRSPAGGRPHDEPRDEPPAGEPPTS
jgi:citrate lyase beta subunit